MADFHETETPDGDAPYEGATWPAGVPMALVALLGAVVVGAAPYAIEGADRFRAWSPGEDIPFADKFRMDGVGPVVAEAGGHLGGSKGLESAELAALAGSDEALEAEAAPAPLLVVKAAPDPSVDTGTPTDDASAPAAAATPQVVVPPSLWEGVEEEIEDPHGSMKPFYEALRKTALAEDGAVTRVSHWGDSAIGADGMTSAARRLLQRQFGDAGHGFILVESGSAWYRHKDVRVKRRGWKAQKIIDNRLADGRYGFGGVRARGYFGANATFGTVDDSPVGGAVDRFELYYEKGPKRGTLALSVDGGEPTSLSTMGETIEEAVHVVEVPDGAHQLRIKVTGGGPVYTYGVVMERTSPGVVYDCLGLVGARSSRLLNADATHWKGQLAQRDPDLMVLMYGGNDIGDKSIAIHRFRDTFQKMVDRFRSARPEAACLVMSPLDHGERHRGRVRTVPRLHDLMAVQREVALEAGCAWYSVFEAMGGEGSMGRWFKASPRLGWGDFAHATPAGARVLGDLFYRALMKGFSDHLAARP